MTGAKRIEEVKPRRGDTWQLGTRAKVDRSASDELIAEPESLGSEIQPRTLDAVPVGAGAAPAVGVVSYHP